MPHEKDPAGLYAHMGNKSDPAARRTQLAGLWVEDGIHYVRAREVRGHADLETRVATSHQTNVAERNYWFVVGGAVEQLRDMVKFNWRIVGKVGGADAAIGLIVLIMAEDGRIRIVYMFIVHD